MTATRDTQRSSARWLTHWWDTNMAFPIVAKNSQSKPASWAEQKKRMKLRADGFSRKGLVSLDWFKGKSTGNRVSPLYLHNIIIYVSIYIYVFSLSLSPSPSPCIYCVLNTFPSSKRGIAIQCLRLVLKKNRLCNPTAVCRVPGFHVLVLFRFLGP